MTGPEVSDRTGASPTGGAGTDKGQASIGDLVSLAIGDLTKLVKYEVDLAKIEMKADARRLGLGAGLLTVAAFVGALLVVLLCFAYAYGLMAAGIWPWAAFLIVAATCVLFAGLAVLVGLTRFRGVSGLRKTRQTVAEDLTLIRRGDALTTGGAAETR